MYLPFANMIKNNFQLFKQVEKKNNILFNFIRCRFHTKATTRQIEHPKSLLKLHLIENNCNINLINNEIAIKKKNPLHIYDAFNNSIQILNNEISEENKLKKTLYFKFKARKSYKKRVMNLPTTKSRRRYAQKNR
ncbi:conserved protein, unknown function [Hepatocystis sp. ex Piliocolobus tephrosceles]|nr:conserved protein, unknown function [Hepatocystis sp. ex Piliocolobus tephrosceles]